MNVSSVDQPYRLGDAPGAVPVLGNALNIFRDPLNYLPSLRHEGDLVKVKLGRETAYMACTHEVIQELLHNPRTFDKGGEFIDKMRIILGDGVGTCSATTHKRQRSFLQPAFRKDRLAQYTQVMQNHVGELIDSWRPGQQVTILDEMSRLTTRVTAQAMFSDSKVGAAAIAEVQRSFPKVWHGVYRRMFLPVPFLHELPIKANREYREALQRLDDVIATMVAAYRADGLEHDDILSIVLAGRDEDGVGLTDEQVRDELMTILAAGVETPASGLASAFWLLSQTPEAEAKLHAEVDAVLGGRTASYEDFANLPYTNMVVNEALRMYPPVWFITRRAVEDSTLAGYPVPAGSSILFSPYALHRDPSLFPDPDAFVPERWTMDSVRAMPRGACITFSGGSRKCLGDVLANQEMTIAIASIAARWRLRAVPGHTFKPLVKAELSVGTLPMTVESR
ncbi:cytochrome P450 [Kribbella solani]|uniref:Pentalenene oxygenase n=1 Tax=Kribbella solani TaxID=236067 RepID=A0A841DPY5_9ACTN|nr:cytochrome P450 [Kribbella solani]MBB5979899.1 pentalenene oxygenase [Kribbella solani]